MTRTDRTDYINRTLTVNTYKVITIDADDVPAVFYVDLPELSPKGTKTAIDALVKRGSTLVKYTVSTTREEMRRLPILAFYDMGEVVEDVDKTEEDTKKED